MVETGSRRSQAALQENWAALSPEILEAMPPEDAFVAQYVPDEPKYWYNPKYNASSLWQGVPVNMGIIKVFRDLFADYELSWSPARLNAPVWW